jgi:hypothetical protein
MLCCLARVPDIAERRHRALTNGEEYQIADLRDEAAEIYRVSVTISQNLQHLYLDAASKAADTSATKDRSVFSPREWILYANFQRLYGLSLFTTCFLNCLFRSFSSDEANVGLRVEAAQITGEIITLAQDADVFRPLGSSYMILCLFIAWVSGPDNETRARINELWKVVCSDVPSVRPSLLELENTPMGYTLLDIMEGISSKWAIVYCEGTNPDPDSPSRRPVP